MLVKFVRTVTHMHSDPAKVETVQEVIECASCRVQADENDPENQVVFHMEGPLLPNGRGVVVNKFKSDVKVYYMNDRGDTFDRFYFPSEAKAFEITEQTGDVEVSLDPASTTGVESPVTDQAVGSP